MMLGELRHDVVHGIRQMRRSWRLTLLATLMLGTGVGAATAIAGAADHVLLRPLPYAAIDRVVTIWERDEQTGEGALDVAAGNFLEWKARSSSYAAMGLAEPSSHDLSTDGPPLAVPSWHVTAGWFEALGVSPVIGRLFDAAEYERGAPFVVLISEGLWNREFAGDPGVIGRTLQLDERAATVVGVVAGDVKYPEATDIWAPKVFRDAELTDRVSNYMHVVARLAPGITLEQARAEAGSIAAQLQREYPVTNGTAGIDLVPLEDRILGRMRPALLVLVGAVVFLLMIACANVATLLLASGSERGRELAVRASLGAGRSRLLRQLAAESLVLSLLGGLLGIVLARFAMRALIALSPSDVPRIEHLGLDGRVLVLSLVITLFTAVAAGLAPALRFSRVDLMTALRSGGRTATSGRDRQRMRGVLVISEVALALVLLIGAGLLMRSFVLLIGNDLGFETRNRASLQAFLWDRNIGSERLLDAAVRIEESLRSTPGVVAVGATSALPFHPHAIVAQTRLGIEGRPVPEQEVPSVHTNIVSPSYFSAMGIAMREGRGFEDSDRANTPRVVVINESLARRYFAGERAIGRRIVVGAMSRPEMREIVGIVSDVRSVSLDNEARPEVYVPLAQVPNGSLTFVVRTERDAAAMLPILRERLWSVDPGQSIYWSATLDQLVGSSLAARRFQLVILASFSVIALVLAAAGLYGLISFTTQQRRNEIGVRMALGAQRSQIVGMIVGQGLRLAVPGIVIGAAGALALTRLLGSMLYGVTPTDPATFAQIGALMVVVAVIASCVPAWRAVSGNPLRSIRTD